MTKGYPIQVLLRESFEGILAAIFLALFLRFFIVTILYMPSVTMSPSVEKGDFIIGWRTAYGFPLPFMDGERLRARLPLRGDLVSFRFPGDRDQWLIRRVVALPGDRVEIRSGLLFINGKRVSSKSASGAWQETSDRGSYAIRLDKGSEMKAYLVPKGEVFVLSDNRSRADDSRDWGAVPVKNLESRLAFIWLSLDQGPSGLKVRWSRLLNRVH